MHGRKKGSTFQHVSYFDLFCTIGWKPVIINMYVSMSPIDLW